MKPEEILTDLKLRMDWADAKPSVLPNGDRNAVTVPHTVMDALRGVAALHEPGWAPLWAARRHPSAAGTISTEYPGLWVRSLINLLEREGA